MNDEVQTPVAPETESNETPDAPPADADPMNEQPQGENTNGVPQGSADTDGDDDDSDDDDAPADGKAKKAPNGLYISTPEPLKSKIETEAAAAGKTPRAYVRDFLAAHWGLVLTPARTRTTYESPEQKKEALKAKRQEKNALIKRLLEEHEKAQAAAAAEAAKLTAPAAA